MAMDGVDRMLDGASMPAEDGGMTGPSRWPRPSAELIMWRCVCLPATDAIMLALSSNTVGERCQLQMALPGLSLVVVACDVSSDYIHEQ